MSRNWRKLLWRQKNLGKSVGPNVVVLPDGSQELTTTDGVKYIIDAQGFTKFPGVSFTPCHEGLVSVFSSPDGMIKFHGGGWNRGAKDVDPNWLIIDVGGVQTAFLTITGFTPIYLTPYIKGCARVIAIDWPDYQAVSYDKSFWDALLSDLKSEAKGDGGTLNVLVCCVGGHGRTGTVLSLLAGIYGLASNPIKFVREKYCQKAVETVTQIEYVKKITGLHFSASPTKEINLGYSKYMAGGGGWRGIHSHMVGNTYPQVPAKLEPSTPGGGEWWDTTKCVMCLGKAVDGLCMGCRLEEADCDCKWRK